MSGIMACLYVKTGQKTNVEKSALEILVVLTWIKTYYSSHDMFGRGLKSTLVYLDTIFNQYARLLRILSVSDFSDFSLGKNNAHK